MGRAKKQSKSCSAGLLALCGIAALVSIILYVSMQPNPQDHDLRLPNADDALSQTHRRLPNVDGYSVGDRVEILKTNKYKGEGSLGTVIEVLTNEDKLRVRWDDE